MGHEHGPECGLAVAHLHHVPGRFRGDVAHSRANERILRWEVDRRALRQVAWPTVPDRTGLRATLFEPAEVGSSSDYGAHGKGPTVSNFSTYAGACDSRLA